MGWGPWSPSSDSLEAQDIILPAKRAATYMLMRWFNKPEGGVSRWELSRRVSELCGVFGSSVCVGALMCERFLPVFIFLVPSFVCVPVITHAEASSKSVGAGVLKTTRDITFWGWRKFSKPGSAYDTRE